MAELGQRIRDARVRAGLSQREVAARVGVNVTGISKIETGRRQVKVEELSAISEALGVAPTLLLTSPTALGDVPGAVGAPHRVRDLVAINRTLAPVRAVGRPALADPPQRDRDQWGSDAERLAEWVRVRAALGAHVGQAGPDALADVFEEHFGVDVLIEPIGAGPIGSAVADRACPLIFADSSQPTSAVRFTLAHELAHILTRPSGGIVHDLRLDGLTDDERSANAFAASFLMPATLVAAIVDRDGLGPDAAARLMVKCNVNWQTVVYRLHNLRYIDAKNRVWLERLDQRSVADHVADPVLRAAVLTATTTPCGIRHVPRWLTSQAWDAVLREELPLQEFAALVGEADAAIAPSKRDTGSSTFTAHFRANDPNESETVRYSGSPL